MYYSYYEANNKDADQTARMRRLRLCCSIWVDKHERSCAGSSGSAPSEVPHFLEIPHHGSNV